MNALASWNISVMVVTLEVSHVPISWLNAGVEEHLYMFVTLEVPMSISWLNAWRRRTSVMVVTLEVSHVPISWLNALAPRNIRYMVVTLEVSHRDISALKDPLL